MTSKNTLLYNFKAMLQKRVLQVLDQTAFKTPWVKQLFPVLLSEMAKPFWMKF